MNGIIIISRMIRRNPAKGFIKEGFARRIAIHREQAEVYLKNLFSSILNIKKALIRQEGPIFLVLISTKV